MVTSLLHGLLAYVLLPLWLAAGAADWLCHRRTLIERTSGVRESVLHLALFLTIALPLVAALFFEINTTLLFGMAFAVLAHSAISLWDTSYAQPLRHIAPVEQQVHSFLEMLPLFAVMLVIILEWQLIGTPHWEWQQRRPALPTAGIAAVLAGLALGLLFIVEEMWRCRKHSASA